MKLVGVKFNEHRLIKEPLFLPNIFTAMVVIGTKVNRHELEMRERRLESYKPTYAYSMRTRSIAMYNNSQNKQ
jgi:hypothetical protein